MENVLDLIEAILTQYEINWKTLLLVVSAVQICYITGNRKLKGMKYFLHFFTDL